MFWVYFIFIFYFEGWKKTREMNRFYFEVINNFLLKKREREREKKLVGVGGAWRIRGGKKKAREPTMSWGHLRSCHSGSHYRLAWAQIGTSKAKEPRATPIGVKFQFHPLVLWSRIPGGARPRPENSEFLSKSHDTYFCFLL